MASAYGIIHQYGEPKSTFDTELAAGVLQARQQGFDTNIIKVEQTLQQLGLSASMMARPEDQEYMFNKVSDLINSIPSLKDTDFSSNSDTRTIMSKVNEALDSHVIKHLGESKKIRDFQSKMQALQQDNPEAYSQVNYQDAMMRSGFYDYMNPESGVDSIKGFDYVPYVNNQNLLLDGIEKAKKVIGEQEIDFQDTDGTMIKKKVSNMTISEWMRFMPNLVTPEMEAQMRVEARAAYGWDDNVAKESVAREREMLAAPYDSKIRQYQVLLDNKNLSPEQKAKFRKEIQNYKAKKEEILSGLNPENVTAEALGFSQIYSQLIRDNSALVGADPSLTFLDPKKFGGLASPMTAQDALRAIGVEGVSNFTLTSEQIQDFDSDKFETQKLDASQNAEQWLNLGLNRAKESADFDFESTMQVYLDAGKTRKEAETQTVFDFYEKSGKPQEILEGKDRLRQLQKMNNIQEFAHEQFVTNGVFKANSEKLYKALKEEGIFDRQKIVIEGREMSSKQYLEEVEGINSRQDLEEFLDDPERSRELVSQMFGDAFLNEVNYNATGGATNIGSILKKGGGRVANISKSTLHNYDRFTRSLGVEGRTFTDDFKVSIGDTATREFLSNLRPFESISMIGTAVGLAQDYVRQGEDDRYRELSSEEVRELANEFKLVGDIRIELRDDADPRIVDAIGKRLKYVSEKDSTTTLQRALNAPGDVVSSIFGGDSNFYDDYSIREMISYDSKSYKDGYNKAIQQGRVQVATPNKVTIGAAPTTKQEKIAHNELRNAIADPLTQGNLDYDPKKPATIYVNPSDPTSVVIEQNLSKEFLDDDKEEVRSVVTKAAKTIDISQFARIAPTLYQNIEFGEEAGKILFNQKLNEEAVNLGYLDAANEKQTRAYLNVFPPQVVSQANSSDAKFLINNTNRQLFEQQPMLGILAEEAISNSDKFKVKLVEDDEGNYAASVAVNTSQDLKNPDFQSLTNIPLDASEIDQAVRVFDVAPQVFLTQALQKIFALYQREGSTSPEKNSQTNLLLEALFQNQ